MRPLGFADQGVRSATFSGLQLYCEKNRLIGGSKRSIDMAESVICEIDLTISGFMAVVRCTTRDEETKIMAKNPKLIEPAWSRGH